MPELPEIQALSERLHVALGGETVAAIDQLGFSGLKTVRPMPADLVGGQVAGVSRRGKYLVVTLEDKKTVLIHLSQAGRLDLEQTAKATKPRGSVVRFCFASGSGVLVREYGHERKAGWWILEAGDIGPLSTLGPEPGSEEFANFIRTASLPRQLNGLLRDQRVVAGLGRGHTDDILHFARLSPFVHLASLDAAERETLLLAIKKTLEDALVHERERSGGLSEARLGERFIVHNRAGEPCPTCGERLGRVSYESYELVYCPSCQTNGKVLADRRLSRLLR